MSAGAAMGAAYARAFAGGMLAKKRARNMIDYSNQGIAKRRMVTAAPPRGGIVGARGGYRKGLQRAYDKEKGYTDTTISPPAIDTTGTIALLNTVAQGAAVTQRVGKKIAMKGLQCRGYAANNSAATFNDCALIIVYDKRPTGALPAITDILITAHPVALNNDTNAGRFRILKRMDWMMAGNITLTGVVANYPADSTITNQDWWLDLKGLSTVYKAAGTGAIGDIEEGALYVITVGSNVAGTASAGGILNFRMRFLDV